MGVALTTDMTQRFCIDQKRDLAMTTLRVQSRDSDLEIKIVSRLGRREQRLWIRQLWQHIRPALERLNPVDTIHFNHNANGFSRSRLLRFHRFRAFRSAPLATVRGNVGAEIRSQRLKLGLTQQALAPQLGIQRSHLSDLERGLHKPNAETLAALEKTLSVKFSAHHLSDKHPTD